MNPQFLILPTLLLTSSLLTLKVLAFTPEERMNAIVALNNEVAQAEAMPKFCSRKFPQTAKVNRKLIRDWKVRNGLQDFDRVLASILAQNPELKQSFKALKASYAKRAEDFPTTNLEAVCKDLPNLYAQPGQNMVAAQYARDLEVMAEIARELDAK
jgi:hypothetical protein